MGKAASCVWEQGLIRVQSDLLAALAGQAHSGSVQGAKEATVESVLGIEGRGCSRLREQHEWL
jgi:hypothetical protein